MNSSDTKSEVSNEEQEHNEFSQGEVTEDVNVIDEVDLSDTEVIETEIHTQDDNQDSVNRTDVSQSNQDEES